MIIRVPGHVMDEIHAHAERSYPAEAAGFLLGAERPERAVTDVIALRNGREATERNRRYLLIAEEYANAEMEAERRGLGLIGVFHSHPDHPNLPSEFDREWAQPFFSYLITSVKAGTAGSSRSWRLAEDRSKFIEEEIQIEM